VFLTYLVLFLLPLVLFLELDTKKQKKEKCQLLNFLVGEAKVSIYLTRRDRLQGGSTLDVVTLWRYNVKAGLRLEFCFHRVTGNVDVFAHQWAHEGLLCQVAGGELKFASFLN